MTNKGVCVCAWARWLGTETKGYVCVLWQGGWVQKQRGMCVCLDKVAGYRNRDMCVCLGKVTGYRNKGVCVCDWARWLVKKERGMCVCLGKVAGYRRDVT